MVATVVATVAGGMGMEGEVEEEEGPSGVESVAPADYKRGEF